MTIPQADFPIAIWQNRPAEHAAAVFFCADDRYAPYTLFLAAQIAAAHPDRDFDICIVSSTRPSPHALHQALNIRLVQVDVETVEQRAKVGARIGMATYLRLFMPQIWAQDYQRLLYLDGDIFYQRGDISRLLRAPLFGAPLGAVLDTKHWHKPRRPAADITALGLPFAPYFNGGVLLIDTAAFNAAKMGARILDLITARGKELVWHDQTAINAIAAGNWAQLPVQWNYQYNHKTMLHSAHFDVCLYHFIGRRKPFYPRYGGFARRFTDAYRKFLAQHFPPLAAQVPDGLGGPARWRAAVLILAANLIMLRGALRIEAQSGGDFDILPPQPALGQGQ